MLNILQLIESSSNLFYKKKASTLGGEFSGPCPWCGGEDRFSIHPQNDHYVCRHCKRAGDSIKFLIDFEGQSYRQACLILGIPPNKSGSRHSSDRIPTNTWSPRCNKLPNITWQNKATAYLFQCFKFLMSAKAKEIRKWLNERGISNHLIKKARLGWNSQSVSFSRESWGLPVDENDADKNRQIWIPVGLLIPYFENGKLIRLRIRQENPVSTDRFILVTGSSTNYLDHSIADKSEPLSKETADTVPPNIVMVVEAELDGWLLHDQAKQAGLPLTVLSIGNSSTRPNESAHAIISGATQVLSCLDCDQAGDTETVWWNNQYPHSTDCRMPSGYGKDPGEAFKAGLDLKEWLTSCVLSKAGTKESFFNAVAKQVNKIKKQLPLDSPAIIKKAKVQKDPEYVSKICIHGYLCMSIKDNICLRTNQNIFKLSACPAEQWYIYQEGLIKQVILGFRFRKQR